MSSTSRPPSSLELLAERFDASVLDAPRGVARVALEVVGRGAWDAHVADGRVRLEPARPGADAEIRADAATWERLARDVAGGMAAFEMRRLHVRRNLHLGVGFLAATSGNRDPGRLKFHTISTKRGRFSVLEAGTGEPLVMLHGLGGTKASFLPTISGLAPLGYRTIAIDLPGFGDSDKPFPAPYDAPFFARRVHAAVGALGLDRFHLLGHSLGGRVALEIALHEQERLDSLVLLTPSLAWLRAKPWAPYLRLVRPELGVIQPAPRAVVERIVRTTIAGGGNGWVAAGVDEFLRAYLTPRGRAAFYAAARHIYLEDGAAFWERLGALEARSLFLWGRRDPVVPMAFARHVRRILPAARHVEVDTGHVPQLERSRQVNAAIADFLASVAETAAAQRAGSRPLAADRSAPGIRSLVSARRLMRRVRPLAS